MEAVVWSDYLCPWCYLGRDRTALLRSLGVEVTPLPYDLHPELPAVGRRVSPNGRLAAVLARIADECAEVGLPFRVPEHIPNTARSLETVEVVRRAAPDAFAPLDDALFRAVFVTGDDIGDADILDGLVAASGADPSEVRRQVEAGLGRPAVDASMTEAHAQGVGGTPAWLIDGRLLVPGVQPRETMERWVRKMLLA
jgi:predicted DsbA family dithiol-disulfide isomerase